MSSPNSVPAAPSANGPSANAPSTGAPSAGAPAPAPAPSGGILSGITSFFSSKPAATVPCTCPTCGNEHTRPAPASPGPATRQDGAGRRSRRNRRNRKNRKASRKH